MIVSIAIIMLIVKYIIFYHKWIENFEMNSMMEKLWSVIDNFVLDK